MKRWFKRRYADNMNSPAPSPQLMADLVDANRILADQGIVDAFGHVSVRHDRRADRFLLARNLAPGLVTESDILEYEVATGEAVHAALLATPFTSAELMGLLPGVDFSVDSPFPTGSAKVNVATMKDGKVVRAAGDVPVPTVPKW
mgnify:CR=1 FL=1